ncbi:MAG: pectinesterase family protein, partial [Terracidiphilus sp.]
MLPQFRLAARIIAVLFTFVPFCTIAQTPVAFPTTMTTLDSSSGAAARGGVVVDTYGNVFISDDIGGKVYMVNQSAGTTSTFTGGSTSNCSGAISSSGDGCAFASTKTVAGMRNIGIDPYGNVLLADYSNNMVHILCRAASPLCTTGTPSPSASSPIQVQVGFMGLVAGCTTGSGGTKATGLDNAPGFMTASSTYSTSTFQTSSCTTSGTTLNPDGATADVYGNVYYADLGSSVATERWRVVVGPASYNGLSNPLYAVLAQNTAWPTITPGYVYTIADGNTGATTKGSACTTAISGWSTAGTATDTIGDGCLFTSSEEPANTSYAAGVVVDAAGNMLYVDPTRGLRVLFVQGWASASAATTAGATGTVARAGVAMYKAIQANNSSVTPTPGYIYMLAGGGATAISSTPTLGTSTAISTSGARRLAISPQGDVYIGVYSSTAASNAVYFFDINTGYVRVLLVPGANPSTSGSFCVGSLGAKAIDTIGDGCPVSNSSSGSFASFGNSGSALPLAVDAQGNLYIYDNLTNLNLTMVRKVLAQGMAAQTVGTTQTQTLLLHFPESETIGASTTPATALSANGDIAAASVITPKCTQRSDLSVDCTVGVTSTPSAAGQRSAALTVTLPAVLSGTWDNGSATVALGSKVTGSVMVIDGATLGGSAIPLTTSPILNVGTPTIVAVDEAGNAYGAHGLHIYFSIGGMVYGIPWEAQEAITSIAVDAAGNVFATESGESAIEEINIVVAGTPTVYNNLAASLTYTPSCTSCTATPQAVAVDNAGNIFVADFQASGSAIYRLSVTNGVVQQQTTVAGGLTNPVSLAVDLSGNVYVADEGAKAVYKLAPGATGSYTQSTLLSTVTPVALAVDPAGDVYVQDDSTLSVLESPISVSGSLTSPVTVLSGLVSPVGLAVDGKGNVYSADSSIASITEVVRDADTCNFGTELTAGAATCSGTLTNAGNQATTGSVAPPFFTLNGCGVVANALGVLSPGEACALSATMSATATNTVAFLPASTVGSLTLTGTDLGTTYNTSTSIAGPTPISPTFSSGAEATFTVTVAPSAASGYTGTAAPGGTPIVWVCQGSTVCVAGSSYATFTSAALAQAGSTTSGSATVSVTGLPAGTYNINASYGGGTSTGPTFESSSTSTGTPFSIGQVSTSANWTPGAVTQQVSASIGTTVLNATATPSGIAGNFVYTATCTSGNCTQYSNTTIDASTYLPIGTYALGATFVPSDSIDYVPSSISGGTYTVTQATTTAAVGASTNVVAADGTGNYTSLTAALTALPATGGTIYLKPGTYSGQNAISYPNVHLRGLGGNATQVILTDENGNFSTAPAGFTLGPAKIGGDEGSAVLDVSKNGFMGTTAVTGSFSPAGFYAEYLTIQNTYNTNPLRTISTPSGASLGVSCTGTGTLQSMYNAGTECGSQALALWIESDQAILNNVNLTSQQDTLYAAYQGTAGSTFVPARQYMWQGLITGDVDYVFGDAAMVFDHTNFFTTWHGTTATGTETIEAQNKRAQTGSASDYLSGYICNACTLMSQSTGMTGLYYGRPYGQYSTWIMLNSFVDQVNPVGWIEFSGDTNLPTSTYAEFNTQTYTDPAVGTSPYPAILFYPTTAAGGVIPTGNNIGAGVTGTRETSSTDPGTLEASNTIKTQLTAAEATPYYPLNFLSTPVSTTGGYSGMPTTWNPIAALASAVNSFAPTTNVGTLQLGSSVTILGRPQTPGAGVIPAGTYTFMDGSTTLASGSLDASGEAYLTTNKLATGTHSITMVYGGDSNFTGSTSSPYTITIAAQVISTTTALTVTNTSSTYGGTIAGTVAVTPASGSEIPDGTVNLLSGSKILGNCALASSTGTCTFSLSGVPAGAQTMTASYVGATSSDDQVTFGASNSNGVAFTVNQAVLHVTANNATMILGGALPTFTYTTSGYVNSDTSSVLSGAPSLTTIATGGAVGDYPITITTGTLAASNYTFAFTNGMLVVTSTSQTAPVATGDSRTVTEPVFPAVCKQLAAALTSINDDIPASVDATVTNPDGARIQTALNNCAGTGQAVELSVDGAGHNAYLTGPLSMPSNVTLLVDPGVFVYFSRNAQDYDIVAGTHTCGTVNSSSATSSCLPLIQIGTSANPVSNVGIMGFGKLDGRGGDTLINAISPYAGQSWWGLSSIANSGGNQQNPRFIQISNATNVTLYKITLRNSPLFHVSTTGGQGVNGFTAWDMKIVTPTTSRNTDGIDPGNAQNVTITQSWISDGDDNVAVGAANTVASQNISVTNDHFFAGHGESIGSITEAGVSNVLFDGNMSAGNGFAGFGSTVSNTGTFAGGAADGNSTAVRIKSANDRGGLVTGIQYSNSCFLDHKVDVQFTPYYSNGDSATFFPNFKNILMQNIVFMNDDSGAGTEEYTGEFNTNFGGNPSPVINPLYVTLDNVTFPSAISTLVNTTIPVESTSVWSNGNFSGGSGQYANLTVGPGEVSANFISAFQALVNVPANNDALTNNITATSLNPPTCNFTYIAPELTGPTGLPQTITFGQNAEAVVILTPTVGGAAYPTGTVTLTDALNGNTTTTTLTGTSDTISIPLIGLSAGTHTFTATYSGDSNYKLATGQTAYSTAGPYVITVNSGSLSATTTSLAVVPGSVPYGSPVTATATVTGISPTGTVQFTVNGATNVTAPLISGTATATITLPFSISPFSITAIYSGDAVNAGSTSTPPAPVTVTAAITTTAVSANPATAPLGHPILLTATVTSVVGTPASALVTFAYSTTVGGTQTMLGSVASTNGAATYFVNNFAVGTYYVTASYAGTGPYSPSTSTAITIAVTPATNIIQLSSNPIALPYIMTNIAGGGAVVPSSGNMLCTGATDKYGDGCQATAIAFTAADDMRGVDADPFGSVYLTDISAQLIRRIAPNGVITNFAGRVTGTACLPTATVGCTPTLVSLSKPRGVSSDAVGNIFIPDYSGNKVYEVKVSTGLMYLVAGNGTAGSTGDGSAAISAEVDQPRSAWGDSLGNIYIAETANNKIRVVDTIGNIHTFAGIGGTSKISSGDGGPATAANFYNPQGVFVDANLNVYIADSAGRIRVVCVTCGSGSPLDALLSILGISPVNGDIYTIAGNGSSGTYTGTYPTFATNVAMAPQKLSMDNSGNLYISDSNGFVWFLDFHTGYLRAIAANATTACTGATDTFGDGCPATQAEFGSNGGNGLGAGTDTQGNLYVSDSTNGLIREVITGLVSPTAAIGSTPTSQSILLHFVPNDGLAFSNSLAFTSTEWSLGSPATTANLDGTTDSLITSEFAPLVPGARSTPLTVNSVLGNKSSLALAGIGRGSGTTVDPATQTTFGANLSVAGLATDNAGNVYVSDVNSKNVLRFATSALKLGSSATSTTLATLTAPGAVAVDPRGFVYAADTSTGLITQIAPTGTVSTLPFTFTTPAGLAVDALNNLYVSDYSAQAVYEINPITGVERMLPLGTLVKPEGLAIDSSGNLLVADPGAPALYRFNPSGTITTVSTSAVAPAAVVTDAAGNLLIADTADILAVPASSNSSAFTVASLVPASLAIDTEGNLYTGSGGSVLELNRTQAYVQFQGAAAPSQPVSLLESGNFALTLTSISQTDTADYGLVATASTDCTLSGALPSGLAIGGVCALTASYTPTTFATTTDTATFNGNIHNTALSTPTLVQLVLTGPAVTPTATIVLNPFSPASPVYGQTVTVSATVAGPSLTPAGTVTFTIDSSTMTATLISGVATVSVPGLGAGTHTVSAAYTSSNGYPPASTPTTILTVIPATATVTLSNLSQTYSGSPITATVTTNPAALAVNVT